LPTGSAAVFQAAPGDICSSIFNGSGGSHRMLFAIGAGAFSRS
jgi:hypothetical protein